MNNVSRTWEALRGNAILNALRAVLIRTHYKFLISLKNPHDCYIGVLQASGVIPSFGGVGVGAV